LFLLQPGSSSNRKHTVTNAASRLKAWLRLLTPAAAVAGVVCCLQVHTATSASQYLPVGVDNAWDYVQWTDNFR
jgi:hypothetical protein